MDHLVLVVVALAVIGFGLVSERLQRSVVTPPMVFVLIGLAVSGPALGLIDFSRGTELIEGVAELTLVLLLFTDASRIRVDLLRREHDLPVRLLAIGLPLTMVTGTLAGLMLLPDLTVWQAAVLAVILAPTDAALGQAVVSSPRVPARIRQALNVESGLNDGIALPVLLFALSAASADPGGGAASWLLFGARQVVVGPAVGIAVGYVGGRAVAWGIRSGWMSEPSQELSSLGLSVLAYGGAELLGGNGFLAAFSAGLTIGNTADSICARVYEFAEAEGQLLTLVTFLIFGGAMVWPALSEIDARALLYATASLTLVRMVPVLVSVLGHGLRLDTILFLGWFGPRGVASILYALLVVEGAAAGWRAEVFAVVMVTVLMSVVAHGLTAWPGARWYAARSEVMTAEDGVAELKPVTEMPVRLPLRAA
jgi:NhaP-type Na+/H+ or K+/H+ antiporter